MASSTPLHRELLVALRQQFPQPVSDPVHDSYVVFSILRALDQVDSLKSQAPILGTPTAPDYAKARLAKVAADGRTLEQVIPELVRYLHGMFIWGHPRSQINVVPHPSIASIIGVLLPSIYNPNLCSDESGHLISEAEVRAGFDGRRAGRLRSGEVGGRVHLRRHRRLAVRREGRTGKSVAGQCPQRRARRSGGAGLRAAITRAAPWPRGWALGRIT